MKSKLLLRTALYLAPIVLLGSVLLLPISSYEYRVATKHFDDPSQAQFTGGGEVDIFELRDVDEGVGYYERIVTDLPIISSFVSDDGQQFITRLRTSLFTKWRIKRAEQRRISVSYNIDDQDQKQAELFHAQQTSSIAANDS